jgi:pimeloyl-ACP methyl ester carboxylesterase
MGATGDVWEGFRRVLDRRWPGRWVTPDLPGHGGSAPLSSYSFDRIAEAVAGVVPPSGKVFAIGHSMGGVVALALASGRFGISVAATCGLGIKVRWTDEELDRARALASRPRPIYATRAEAAERHLKVAGLGGLIDTGDVPAVALRQIDGRWTLAFDPAVFGIGAPSMEALLASATGPAVLAAGERDPMSREEELRALVPDPIILPGLGHNAHVEAPEALWLVIERMGA